MNHPALRHIRNTLIAALGLAGCTDEPAVSRCEDPQPLLDPAGMPTGYVTCADDGIDRVGPAACPAVVRYPACDENDFAGRGGECASNADCVDHPGGQCGLLDTVGGSCVCIYPCQSDADCGPDEACVCDGANSHGSRCAPAGCRGPEDCDGGRCGAADYLAVLSCYRATELACRTPDDSCASNAACGEEEDCWPAGGRERAESAIWSCDAPEAVCGRPLRVAAAPRLAPTQHRAGWQAGATLSAPLSTDDRARLAAHWTHIAALEHASVASFARFSMQLLALGAPADLVADCQHAAADEVEHARIAYGIASAFAGQDIGPGPLSLDGITLDSDPATVLREVIVEGCIGETFGALEAAEAARHAIDPAIAAACARIADDELRHAALGWRAARWLLQCHPALAPMASDAFRDGIGSHPDAIARPDTMLATYGMPPRPALRRAAAVAVIGPLAGELLGAIGRG